MDPLSVTASIIAVLQATNWIISFCFDFRSAVKDRPWGLTRLTEEVIQLRNVLEALRNLAEQAEWEPSGSNNNAARSRLPALNQLCSTDGPLERCLEELNEVEKKLFSPKWSGRLKPIPRALIQSIGWRLKDKEVETAVQRFERLLVLFNLALTADEATLLLNIQLMVSKGTRELESIEDHIISLSEAVKSSTINDNRRAMLMWLSPVDPQKTYKDALKTRQTGTCEWFIDSEIFSEWKQSLSSFLWISALPGTGKTILRNSSTVLEHLQTEHKRTDPLLAYFYCDFRQTKSQDPLNVLGSIIAQLCLQLNEFPTSLEEASRFGPAGNQRPPDFTLLVDTFWTISHEHQIIILLDALDECDERADLVSFLSDPQHGSLQTRIIVTSRDEKDLRNAFGRMPRLCLESQSRQIANDISLYVQTRLNTNPELFWLNSHVKAEIQQKLTTCDTGSWMFRWVQCQLDEIAKLKQIKTVRRALSNLPTGLDKTYEQILARVPQGNFDVVYRSLLWLSFSMIPLSLEELGEGVAIEEGLPDIDEDALLSSPQDLLDMCGSLVVMSDSRNEVTLAHLSVKDYLLSTSIRSSDVRRFALSPESANKMIALSCLTYLSYSGFRTGPVKSQESWEERIEKYPLVNYATVCWPYHTRIAGQPADLNSRILNFCNDFSGRLFMSWVQNLHVPRWYAYPPHAHPLYYAASFGLDKTMQTLIKQGAAVDAPGSRFGGTALHAAVLRQITTAMKILLDAGADPEKPDFRGASPLDSAVSWGNKEVIQMLIEYGASNNIYEAASYAAEAAVEGQANIQALMLRAWAEASKKR